MQSQTDVTYGFSQNMPSNYIPKRRYATKKRSRTGAKYGTRNNQITRARTTGESQIWPYRSLGLGQIFDPFPAQIRARLRYNTTVSFSAIGGTLDTKLFWANGIFDPEYAVGGHQPYGHDTYQSIYNHYMVESATIVLTPTENADGVLGCSITDDASVQGNFDTVKETKGVSMKAMGANGTPMNVVQYYNRNQMYNRHQMNEGAAFGSSPTEAAFFHTWFCPKSTSAADETLTCMVSITYTVSMWELKDLGQS